VRSGLVALVVAAALVLAGCGARHTQKELIVGSGPDAESTLLAQLYAAALRSYGTPARVEIAPDPLAELDTGAVSVVPGLTGRLLQTFQPGATAVSDEQVYRAMVAALPEGVAAGDYATAAEDKPALAVSEATARMWGGRDLTVLAGHCGQLEVGSVAGARTPAAVGRCRLPAAREFPDDTALFDALRAGQVNAGWTTTADPDIPADLVVLADRKPRLVRAENAVPLYRRNELTERQVLAINELAGVLDTAALVDMRRQVAAGGDPRSVAEAWLAEHPLGR
jgi:glycine betaine/choline ABC-type transport system substrate-binding protein